MYRYILYLGVLKNNLKQKADSDSAAPSPLVACSRVQCTAGPTVAAWVPNQQQEAS